MTDLKQELEARSLSVTGLKQHLIQRLELALRKERDLEEEEHGKMKINDDAILPGTLKVVDIVKDDEVSADTESKELKKNSPEVSFSRYLAKIIFIIINIWCVPFSFWTLCL